LISGLRAQAKGAFRPIVLSVSVQVSNWEFGQWSWSIVHIVGGCDSVCSDFLFDRVAFFNFCRFQLDQFARGNAVAFDNGCTQLNELGQYAMVKCWTYVEKPPPMCCTNS